jgi:hypothetical protein
MKKAVFLIAMVLLSMFNVEMGYAKDRPIGGVCGTELSENSWHVCQWDDESNTWVETWLGRDNWELYAARDPYSRELVRQLHLPRRVQVERTLLLSPGATFVLPTTVSVRTDADRKVQRFVCINTEGGTWSEEHRIWPHLGINYVGTVAKQEGYDVVLWDELIQGPIPLEELMEPGDMVGLSMVTTGIERGVQLATLVKELGAEYVIAGNDSAMFRARQLLELPERPVDAVFTSNSLRSLREFFRDPDAVITGESLVAHVAVDASQVPFVSNTASGVAKEIKTFASEDFFIVPDLNLFGPEYWELVHSAYRSQFGHKHTDSGNVRNAIALLAQGCGRAGMGDICDYCTIRHVANVVQPPEGYLEETLATYQAHGINTFFNVTDSAFEMGVLANRLKAVGPVDSLVIYGRAQAIAMRPDLLERWQECVRERLLINCGMDSGDERILQLGINKSGSKVGSRLSENYQALANIKAAGPKVHLHFSVIFGSPGETKESCESTLGFVKYAIDTLGEQLDVVEGDVFWVNFGAPCSEIFTDYEAAQRRAAFAGKTISEDDWQHYFARHADELIVPQESQDAWYTFFTNITIEEAWAYNARVREMVAQQLPGRITGREFAFKPPKIV